MPDFDDDFDCPCCGAEVAAGAAFCPECGASDESGWNDEVEEGWAIEDDFDYEEYLTRAFPEHADGSASRSWRRAGTVIVVVLVCLSLALAGLLY